MFFAASRRVVRVNVDAEVGSEIRFEAVYVESQDGRGNQFAHSYPRCAEPLRREGDRSATLAGREARPRGSLM